MHCRLVKGLSHLLPGIFRTVFDIFPSLITGNIKIDDLFLQLFAILAILFPLGFIFFSDLGTFMLEVGLELVALAAPTVVQLVILFLSALKSHLFCSA
jgi:hypothetical protein